MNILVTGCGGDIGFGIIRILQETPLVKKVIGCDIHGDHPARTLCYATELVLPASHQDFLNSLACLVEKYKIDIIIPTSEAELRFFYKNNITSISNALLVMANTQAMHIGFDKLKTAHFLKEHGLSYPWTIKAGTEKPQLPCILKDPEGCGSKHIYIVNQDNLDFYIKQLPNGIFQELLLPNDEEYTCGVYCSKKKSIRTIIFKRRLQGGFTSKGVLVENEIIRDLLRKVALALDLSGSINIQLRLTQKGPIIFEINPRFSSTVVFRHKMGFRDVIWSLQEKIGLDIEPYTPPSGEIKFYRTSDEVIL